MIQESKYWSIFYLFFGPSHSENIPLRTKEFTEITQSTVTYTVSYIVPMHYANLIKKHFFIRTEDRSIQKFL